MKLRSMRWSSGYRDGHRAQNKWQEIEIDTWTETHKRTDETTSKETVEGAGDKKQDGEG